MADDAARHISPEGLATLDAELREPDTEGRRAIAGRIRTAREFGDLKENGWFGTLDLQPLAAPVVVPRGDRCIPMPTCG